MEHLPDCHIPDQLSQAIREAGKQWAISELRPRLDFQIERDWDKLITDWANSSLPLVIRKDDGGMRGDVVLHKTGRQLVFADNSPAQWAFSRAYSGSRYSLSEIKTLFENDLIPFAYATKKDEKGKMEYKCTLASKDNVNKYGWKLCHHRAVGLNKKDKAADLPIELLQQHFCSFLMPSNHFLVPKLWGGFGELPEVIEEVRRVEG